VGAMESLQLVDTHAHFWDPNRLRYSWLRDNTRLNRRYSIRDYPQQETSATTEALVFIECDADSGQSLAEVEFIEEQAQLDPRLRAIVAHAPLERGLAAQPILEQIVSCSAKVRGIRRILQAEVDVRALVESPAFLAGVRLLRKFDLHFEITVNYTQMDCVPRLVRAVPEVAMVLDHCGKPGIRQGQLAAFQRHVSELARYPNVFCKLSGLATDADHATWTDAQLLPYLDAALQAFGPDRLLYGSDWPVCLQATSHQRWINVLKGALAGCTREERRKILRDNANALYRLGLP